MLMNSGGSMKKFKILWVFCLIIIVFVVLFLLGGNLHNNRKMLSRISPNDYDGYDNLMIVAHPDDETLWGFSNLERKKFLVVCVTCGRNKVREKEIENAMKLTDDKLISLGYTDKFLNRRSKWRFSYNNIKYDLDTIIKLKKWNVIITHNKDGEYGHMHHKMIHDMVESERLSNLSYFGKYYTKRKMLFLDKKKLDMYRLDDKTLMDKKRVLEKYKSQKKVKNMFAHMIPYENIDV